MKIYKFTEKERDLEDFFYAYGPAVKEYKEFTQREDCLTNFMPGDATYENIFDYDYISMVTKEKYKSGDKFSTKCNFVKFGAPLLVFCNDFITNADGTPIYQVHYEVVAYEDGCNIWHIKPWPENTERPVEPTLIGTVKFKIEPEELIDISFEVQGKTIMAEVNGHKISCEHPEVPEEFHVGITACEGHNRFFDFKIED